MKLRAAVIFSIFGFFFGLCFYHSVILRRKLLPTNSFSLSLPAIKPIDSYTYSQVENGEVSRSRSSYDRIPLEEVVKGPLRQDNGQLVNYIRQGGFLLPPTGVDTPYNLSHPKTEDFSMGQAKMVLRALNDLKNGFFVECGALDGELRSNTLLLERRYGWRGLLIEGDPKNFVLLRQKNRKAWLSPACLATHEYPHQAIFEQSFNRGKVSEKKLDYRATAPPPGTAIVQCFPLYSLLAALNVSQVDYLSLDVEGAELSVLENFPFDKVRVKVLSVEFLHVPGGREAVRRLMMVKGYHVVGAVRDPIHNWANDLIFLHNSVVPLQPV